MKHKRSVALALLALASTAAYSLPNLVTNGSFETTPTAVNNNTVTVFKNGFLGWTIDKDLEIRNNLIGTAFEGARFAELDAEKNRNNTISQSITTVIGNTYTFSFEYSNRAFLSVANPIAVPATSSGLSFMIGSLSGTAPTQPTINDDVHHWNHFSTTYVATGTTTLLSFTATGTVDNVGSSLDDVQVTQVTTPVPEPGSFALLAAGLSAAGLIVRRRRV